MSNGRSIGKALPVDRRRASINDLEPGQRYSLQVVPITDQPGGVLFRKGEGKQKELIFNKWTETIFLFRIEYDADRHGHYLPSEKLEIDFTDLVRLPKKVWTEQIAGRSALVCWSPSRFSFSFHDNPSYHYSIQLTHQLLRNVSQTATN